MKKIIFFIAILGLQTTYARNFYFSSTLGDDNRSSTLAQNPLTPWRSIDKLNSFFSSLQPGDVILFNRGETFYGSITINKSGTSSQPITITAYGSGNKPVITGFNSLSNWVSVGNGIWESYAPSLGSKLNMVLINGSEYAMGRYPNGNAANGGYLSYESCVTNTTITDNELTASTNWSGAEVVIRKVRGVIDRNLITWHSGNTLGYTSGSTYNASNGFGYFIQNDLRTLDQFGEWYYNPGAKKLNVYFGGSGPGGYDVKATSLDNGVYSNGQHNILFNDLSFQGFNKFGFTLNGGQNMNIQNCDIAFSGESAVFVTYCSNFKIEGCNISWSNNNGIDLAWNDDNAIVRNNNIQNTSTFNGMGTSGDGNSTGINAKGYANTVEYNQIINTGYNGISFNEDYALIKNNYINNYCLIKDDAGGIYTFIGNFNIVKTGRKVIGNIIMNGIGCGYGTNDLNYLPANGIFLDDNASGVEIRDNTIANNAYNGVFFHNAHDIIVTNNTFYNNNKGQLYMRAYQDQWGGVRNNTITGNIFFSKYPTQSVSSMVSITSDVNAFADFDGNYYCRPLDDKMTILNSYLYNNNNNTKTDAYTLAGWKLKSQKDGSSQKSPLTFPAYTINSINSGNKISNGTFNSSMGPIGCWTPLNNCNPSWNSGGKLDGGCLQVSYGYQVSNNWDVTITSVPAGGISSSKNYIVKFSSLGSYSGKSLAVYIRNNDTYNKASATYYVDLNTSRTEHELLFTLPADATNAGVIFEANDQMNTYWIDNVEMYEATITKTNPDNYIRFETNPSASPKTVILDGNYIDVRSNNLSSVTLQPYSSIILMRTTALSSQIINFPSLPNKTFGDAPFTVSATASSGLPVSFSVISGPATISGNTVTLTGTGNVVIEATQGGNGNYSAAPPVTQSFSVNSAGGSICATGTILKELWSNVSGDQISQVNFASTPTSTSQLTAMESPVNNIDNYGLRMRGYICAPTTGSYTFWVSGHNTAELWLSTNEDPNNKVKIAYQYNWSEFRNFTKYPSQKSALVTLHGGQRYYIEVLYKQGTGGDYVSAAWTLPNSTFQVPIPGSVLSPYTGTVVTPPPPPTTTCYATGTISKELWSNVAGDQISLVNFGSTPSSTGELTSLETPVSSVDNYGLRIRGYICAPQTGSYTFWVAGHNTAELWLSTNDDPNNKVKIAYQYNWAEFRNFTKYASQKSALITLQAGERYYIEVLYKQGTGGDYVSAAWTLPNSNFQVPIPGSVLSPYTGTVVTPPPPSTTCSATGTILKELWSNVAGDQISQVNFASTPTSTGQLSSLESPVSSVDNYGLRMRGYICAPQTGSYTFWVAGHNTAELWLSTNDDPNNKVKIAYQYNWAEFRNFTKYSTQKSALITLQAGQRYYIEVLYKQGTGGDYVSAAWTLPNSNFQVPIPGDVLSPYGTAAAPPPTTCTASGSILKEQWNNVAGDQISQVNFGSTPTTSSQLTSLETPVGNVDNYGLRIRGYICAPSSGSYTFWVAGHNTAELWLSTNDDPNNKVKIAYQYNWAEYRNFTKYPSQKSALITLQAGQRYYIEVLYKQGTGGDYVSAAWTLPNSSFQVPIPGSVLSPYVPQGTFTRQSGNEVITQTISSGTQVSPTRNEVVLQPALTSYPNPFQTRATVQFKTVQSGMATLDIIDIQGKLVKQLYSGNVEANGVKTITLNADGLPGSTYILRLVTKDGVLSKKILLTR